MRKLSWNYKAQIQNRESAITWILICKQKSIIHKDLVQKVAEYIYDHSAYDYVDGELSFYRNEYANKFYAMTFWNGKARTYNGNHIMGKNIQFKKDRFLQFIHFVLKLCHPYPGRWEYNGELLDLSKHDAIIYYCFQVSCKNYLLFKDEISEQECWCKTIGDAFEFLKRVPIMKAREYDDDFIDFLDYSDGIRVQHNFYLI